MATSTRPKPVDVSSASARALAAATSTKPRPSPLPTPQSATFPSSLQSPMPTPGFLQAERNKANMRTPLTPPPAYLDFLRNLDSTSLKTPLATSKSANFSFGESQRSPYPWPKQPASARLINNSSVENAAAPITKTSAPQVDTAITTTAITSAPTTQPTTNTSKPTSRRSSAGDEIPNPPLNRSTSLPEHTRPLDPIRRPSLIIPESPSINPPSAMSPPSAHVSRARSPATANAAKSYYISISPDGSTPRALSAPAVGKPQTRPYTVKHVITRTVTYKRPAGTTAVIPGVSVGGGEVEEEEGKPRARAKTPKEDVMRLDSILNESSGQGRGHEEGQKRKSDGKVDEEEEDAEVDGDVDVDGDVEVGGVAEQVTESRSSGPLLKPLVGEVPTGKRRKVG